MTNNSLIRLGTFFFFRGDKYKIEALNPEDGVISAIQNSTWNQKEFTVQELFTAEDNDQLIFAPTIEQLNDMIVIQQPMIEPVNSLDLPRSFLNKAKAVIDVVENTDEYLEHLRVEAVMRGEDFKYTKALEQALKMLDKPVCITTYYKYRNLYIYYSGNVSQIASSFRRSTFNQLRTTRPQLYFIDVLIGEYYSGPNRMRKSLLFKNAKSILTRTNNLWPHPDRCKGAVPRNLIEDLLNSKVPMENILNNPDYEHILVETALPSQRWFYNYLKYFENVPELGKDVIIARYGEEEWESRYTVYESYIHNASRILQYVFADHWLIDLYILNEDDEPIRLWLTVLIDAYSRSILGFALLEESPCIESIQTALLHSIWPKTSHIELGLDDEWISYGIMQHLSLDNTWAHHSHSLEDLARSISKQGQYNSITLDFRPPYKGRYGAIIERLFGNFSDKIKQMLEGAIQSSEHKDIANAKKKARLFYEDLYQYIHELILNYQHTSHNGIGGMTPHEKWVEGLEMSLPIVPKLTTGMKRLFWRMDPQTRKISDKGVSAFGMHYISKDIHTAERIGKDGKSVEYSIRYDPNNISILAIFRDGHYIGDIYAKEMRLADGTLLRISVAEREMAKKLAKDAGQPARDWLKFTN